MVAVRLEGYDVGSGVKCSRFGLFCQDKDIKGPYITIEERQPPCLNKRMNGQNPNR